MLTQKQIDSLPAEVSSHIDVLDAHLDDAIASLNRGAKTMSNARQRIIGLQSVIASLVIIAVASLFIAGMEHTSMMRTEVERQRISEELDEAHVNAAAMGCDLGRHIEKNID
jgi:hypothetical protein